ncbi:galactokinase [Kitasatospora aureofaciens]|uniref:Galactokinase n=1 Tax=Kitasatospora aureofaciens TaxID=1894 RepID=A0A1E7NF35_KITAU|nr:galactokinase [Kitasatospora aureofaciens]OEV39321.1 galactokinase [Kitasatospora aureofaciens]QEV03228.1 galactokinase [Streptomyces viridifaciens]UKZ09900.1 galactokinase [Streptomyces viridifaciens]GGU87962.1 galactokinase [Kitasatospora aureofaciens]
MIDEAATDFEAVHAARPSGVWAAPGRVNLIGEHTDYNDGFVLPIALPHTTRVSARRRTDGRLRLYSAQGDGTTTDVALEGLAPGAVASWASYPAGVFWALAEAGHPVGGADLFVDSDVPTGAGLSSSAALECATAAAVNDLYELGLSAPELALIAQRAENAFVGVPCGVMDQMASACCTDGTALFLDTRTLEQRHVPLDLTAAGLRLLVIDTRVKHDLGDGAYAALRAGCERAAGLLELPALRDLPPADLAPALDRLPGELRPLVRHVVTENGRVLETIDHLGRGDLAALGPVLTAGHASLRDDFRVSCPETDLAVEAAVAAGALGARMTGGGFGGSVIALVEAGHPAVVSEAVRSAFRSAGFTAPVTFTAVPSAGARRVG